MERILKIIESNLKNKGLSSQEFPIFIKDVCCLIENKQEEYQDISCINRRLNNLGWRDFQADQHLLDLLIFLNELKGESSGVCPDHHF